jgi:dTDP-D-glucose 4,6-dehydratase
MPIIITRGNNVYGPYQYPEKLIPRLYKIFLKKIKIVFFLYLCMITFICMITFS